MASLNQYHYQALSKSGNMVYGDITARSHAIAIAELTYQGLHHIAFFKYKVNSSYEIKKVKKIAQTTITTALEKLLTLLQSGETLINALHKLCLSHRIDAALWLHIATAIANGSTLQEALLPYRKTLGHSTYALLAVGASGSNLITCLSYAIAERRKEDFNRQQIKKITLYPKIIFFLLSLITLFVLFWLIPLFEPLFTSIGSDLPWVTVILMHASEMLLEYYTWVIGAVISITLLWFIEKKWRLLQYMFEPFLGVLSKRISSYAPFLGQLLHLIKSAHFCYSLHILLTAGLRIEVALLHLSQTHPDTRFRKMAYSIKKALIEGTLWHNIAPLLVLLPHWCRELIASEPSSLRLGTKLLDIERIMQQEITLLNEKYMRYMEPALMILVGVYTLGLLLAIYVPIFAMGKHI